MVGRGRFVMHGLFLVTRKFPVFLFTRFAIALPSRLEGLEVPLKGLVNLGPDFLAVQNRATAETLIEYESNTGAVSHVPI